MYVQRGSLVVPNKACDDYFISKLPVLSRYFYQWSRQWRTQGVDHVPSSPLSGKFPAAYQPRLRLTLATPIIWAILLRFFGNPSPPFPGRLAYYPHTWGSVPNPWAWPQTPKSALYSTLESPGSTTWNCNWRWRTERDFDVLPRTSGVYWASWTLTTSSVITDDRWTDQHHFIKSNQNNTRHVTDAFRHEAASTMQWRTKW